MGMMQGIIDDAKAMEADAIRAEEDAQETYEEFAKDTNESIDTKTNDLISKQKSRAKNDKQRTKKKVNHDDVTETLEQLYKQAHDIHADCDYILKNFDIRVTARDEEIEALKQTIAMFSGAHFSALAENYVGPF